MEEFWFTVICNNAHFNLIVAQFKYIHSHTLPSGHLAFSLHSALHLPWSFLLDVNTLYTCILLLIFKNDHAPGEHRMHVYDNKYLSKIC
jgi:hypothetical protein